MGNPSGPAGHLPYKAEEFCLRKWASLLRRNPAQIGVQISESASPIGLNVTGNDAYRKEVSFFRIENPDIPLRGIANPTRQKQTKGRPYLAAGRPPYFKYILT